MPNPFTEQMSEDQRRDELINMALNIPPEAWTESIANVYSEDIRAEGRSGNPLQNLAILADVAMQENHLSPTQLDLDHIGQRWATRSESFRDGFTAFRNSLRTGARFDRARAEHLFDGLDKSQFPEFLINCGANRIMERCPSEGWGIILDLFGRMDVDCTDEKMRTPLMIDDLDYECCDPPDAPRSMKGINSPVWSRIGPRCLRRIGLAIKENTRCNGIMALIEDVWNRESRLPFERGEAKRLIAYLLGGCCDSFCGKDNRPYLNNCRFKQYYLAGQGPWANKICNNTDLTACTAEAMVCQIEQMLGEDASDPFNGDQIDCCQGGWDFITFGQGCSTKVIQRALGAHKLEQGNACQTGVPCAEVRTFQQSARARFNRVIAHPYLAATAFEHFKKCYGLGTTMNFSDAQIRQMADRTYIIGCVDQVYKRTIEKDFTRSQYGGRNTYEFFNQGVEKFHGVDVNTGFHTEILKLPGVMLVQGMPDGLNCANLSCTAV